MYRIGDKIRERRERKKWSIDKLAERSGIGLLSLGQIENNRKQPSLKELQQIDSVCHLGVIHPKRLIL